MQIAVIDVFCSYKTPDLIFYPFHPSVNSFQTRQGHYFNYC